MGIDDNDDRGSDDDNEGRSPREVKLERFSRSRSRLVEGGYGRWDGSRTENDFD